MSPRRMHETHAQRLSRLFPDVAPGDMTAALQRHGYNVEATVKELARTSVHSGKVGHLHGWGRGRCADWWG